MRLEDVSVRETSNRMHVVLVQVVSVLVQVVSEHLDLELVWEAGPMMECTGAGAVSTRIY
jgi:hypothetical protein